MWTEIRSLLSRFWHPIIVPVRTRYYAEKVAQGRLVRNYGYKEKILQGGLLPHHPDMKPLPIPLYRPKLSWSRKRALFGQNDYIDILGDNLKLHPTKLLYNVPPWLRGFRGNEYQLCVRRKKVFKQTPYPNARPTKWKELEKRIKYLYRYYNQQKPI